MARVLRPSSEFLKRHSLSLAAVGVVLLWVLLYSRTDARTHLGSFFGNAIADWTGVLVTVIATKFFYEIGSAESRGHLRSGLLETARNHSLTIFLAFTGIGWVVLYLKVKAFSSFSKGG